MTVTDPRTVKHPQLGPGKLLKMYMGGHEWEVEFGAERRFYPLLAKREAPTDRQPPPRAPG